MSEHLEAMKDWTDSFREDVNAVKAIVDNDAIDRDARKFAAAALNYVVTRMDLIPDWTDTIGVVDDVLVLRVCVSLATVYGVDEHLEGDDLMAVARMGNEVEKIEKYLGAELYPKFKKYCARLADQAVRDRTPDTIVDDKAKRAELYDEVDDDLKKMPAAVFDDLEKVSLRLKSYLHAKLDK